MHPDVAFRSEDRALLESLIDQIGFGMVFLTTPDGPRVAHTPLLWSGDGSVQFHLSRANALSRHLNGATALVVINGPDSYVSPRWYDDGEQVPTWNYIALELEGRVRRMDEDGLSGMLEALTHEHEARLGADGAWTMDRVPPEKLRRLMAGIIGFELEVQAWRPTLKVSQNKSAADRAGVIAGLEAQGSLAMAELIRRLAP